MVAITPLDINFLIRSMGLFPTICARSRITMLAGNSTLFPLLLIGPPPQIANSISRLRCRFLLSLRASPVSSNFTWSLARPHTLRVLRLSVHKLFQFRTFIYSQSCFQRIGKRAFQPSLPALAPVMQVGSPSSHFTGRVHLHSFGCADDSNHPALG